MTLDKAIELLNETYQSLKDCDFHDHADAVRLGILALTRLDDIRNHRQLHINAPLTGETEE